MFKGKLTLSFLTLIGFLFVMCLQVAQADVIDIDFNKVPLPSGYDPSTCWEMYDGAWNYFYKTELEDVSYVHNYVSTSSSPCIDPAALPPGPIAWDGGLIFDTFTKYKHATSVSVNVGSFCRLYLPNPAGGDDIMTFSRPDAVLVGYTSDGRTITARATQPVNSSISISAPPGTEFYKSEVKLDQTSTPCTFKGTMFVSDIKIQTANPDLAASTPIVTQDGSTTGPDGLQIFSTGSVQVKVPVSGSNLDSISSQTAAVMLSITSQSPQVQYIPLADIQPGKDSSVTFNVTFDSLNIGLDTITAIVAPGNKFS